MKDIAIRFDGTEGTAIDLSRAVEGKACTVQKCLVNISTMSGSDALWEDDANPRGTELLQGALQGRIVGINDARHLCNFAAVDTVFFVRANDYASRMGEEYGDMVSDISLDVSDFSQAVVGVDASFTFADGTTTISTDNRIAITS